MKSGTMGFIGGGRITRIFLEALNKEKALPATVVVSDANAEVLQKLKARFPEIEISQGDNGKPAAQDIAFLALHPPAIGGGLGEIKAALKPGAILVSLAPRFSIKALSEALGGFNRIVRMIPNAPAIVGEGYNPVAFGPGITKEEKKTLGKIFKALGDCPEVKEENLEAYAMITAMGPTYLWFQFYELTDLGKSFGMSEKEAAKAVEKMVKGALKTMLKSGLSPAEVMDLVPVKPLSEDEAMIRNAYRTKLTSLYQKLKG
jgi:pyrroline-5-carboxylate reductase